MGDFNPSNYQDDFVADLVGFVAGDEFQALFEGFFLKYAHEFEFGEEQKLRYYEIYQDFHDLFESKLEEFCASKGCTQAEFMKRAREATADDEKSKLYMNILLSSVEYETFVKLMYIMKPVAERKQAMEAEMKAMEERYTSLDDKGGAGSKATPAAKGEEDLLDDGKEMQEMGVRAEAKSSRYDEEEDATDKGSK
jgi:hypothetical protein